MKKPTVTLLIAAIFIVGCGRDEDLHIKVCNNAMDMIESGYFDDPHGEYEARQAYRKDCSDIQ